LALINKLDPNVRYAQDCYYASRDAKEQLGLPTEWRTYEDYNRNKQNPALEEDDPGSVCNIIFPTIASQVSDMVDEVSDITAVGEEPSDEIYARDIEHILDWMWFQNHMLYKLDRFAWRWLKFGTSGWKIYYDPTLHRVVWEPVSPINMFPDPKVKEHYHIQQGDFFAHVLDLPIPYLIRTYGDVARKVKSSRHSSDLNIFEGEDVHEVRATTSNSARTIELWTRDSKNTVRRRVIAGDILLYDSKKDYHSFYENGKYPFDVLPCYPVEGRIWGMGDAELLKPTQDLINELDDQIRINARLMGNIQIVVGLASGINISKWTKKSGLRIPARDHNAWKTVEPPPLPSYIMERRYQAFKEAELISGRPDVTEGRRSNVRAASAIMALQEAGNRRGRHKKLFMQESLSNSLGFAVDYLKQFFTEEQAFRILGKGTIEKENPEYIWFRGSNLKTIPKLIPGTEGGLVPLMGDGGKVMTKDAQFDLRVNIGAGMPHNKAFIYQSLLDLKAQGIITVEEARMFLKDSLDWPVANPMAPTGNNFGAGFMGMNMMGNPGVPGNAQEFDIGSIPPQILDSLVATLGGQGGAR